MKGIEFIQENGKTVKAVIDLQIHKALFDEIFTRYQAESSANSNSTIHTHSEGNLADNVSGNHDAIAQKAIEEARTYLGTQHVMGGVSRNGLDCSGLTHLSFKEAGIELSRDSRSQAVSGVDISIDSVEAGDLVFFATGSDPNRISHVGIITKTGNSKDDLEFIHTSTSRGVVEEPLFRYDYWQKAYRHARRVISPLA
ncbi:cell wall-associated hydrolase, invasion-associated protein [Bernardetia litoralis DSM 6794]|uniref:Cell wall-associated hydrolase, invasion-associated protein n=1 Tax=Bernardetia litoralis (strain ATCC 23117 / DSM 6794 / NBRC 15988 / NCIMB 1366 / Fx l1 / Sio-4) TaxID=880071 RepID=I4AMS3_BERLS|nr:C40 family peptidase [Bernardetia litoralis]AFM05258.1 cell wall-associated hydrolase, invasion-associated protein [Bernardetia litoralis DSM 6794]